MQAASGDVPIYATSARSRSRSARASPKAQAYVNQGMRLAFGFNHAEAQRAFQAAQRARPDCAMCFWGEALVLGPNINAPMGPRRTRPRSPRSRRATELKAKAGARDRALIDALAKRYSADPKADRAALDAAYADAMKDVAARFRPTTRCRRCTPRRRWTRSRGTTGKPAARGPKGRAERDRSRPRDGAQAQSVAPGAIHLYIHAVEASTNPSGRCRTPKRLARAGARRGHSCTCRRTSTTASACTASR
jgi:hypothetical protein